MDGAGAMTRAEESKEAARSLKTINISMWVQDKWMLRVGIINSSSIHHHQQHKLKQNLAWLIERELYRGEKKEEEEKAKAIKKIQNIR